MPQLRYFGKGGRGGSLGAGGRTHQSTCACSQLVCLILVNGGNGKHVNCPSINCSFLLRLWTFGSKEYSEVQTNVRMKMSWGEVGGGGRGIHFHQFLTRARYYYSPPCRASHSVIIAQPPAPRYRLETCNILGRAVEPDINTFKERRRWTEEGNNRILLPNNKVLFNFQTSVKLRIHLCSLPMLAAVTMPVQNKQCGRKNQTKPDLPFISPSGGHTVTATAWPPINAATNPRRVMAKIGSGGIQILLENRLSGKPNNKLGVRENKSGKLHRTNPNSPEEKLKSIET